jgi:hypothetical protein
VRRDDGVQFSFSISEPFELALLGAAAALVAAILQPLVQKLTTLGARIRVNVNMRSFSVPKFLETSISTYLWDYKQTPRPSEALKARLRFLQHAKGNLLVEIRNTGRKAVADVSVHLENEDEMLFEIYADGTRSDTHLGKIALIPQVRPESMVRVEIWCGRDYPDWSVWALKRPVNVRASEYKRIVYKLVWPQAVRSRYLFLNKKIMYIFGFVIWVALMLFSSSIKIHW